MFLDNLSSQLDDLSGKVEDAFLGAAIAIAVIAYWVVRMLAPFAILVALGTCAMRPQDVPLPLTVIVAVPALVAAARLAVSDAKAIRYALAGRYRRQLYENASPRYGVRSNVVTSCERGGREFAVSITDDGYRSYHASIDGKAVVGTYASYLDAIDAVAVRVLSGKVG